MNSFLTGLVTGIRQFEASNVQVHENLGRPLRAWDTFTPICALHITGNTRNERNFTDYLHVLLANLEIHIQREKHLLDFGFLVRGALMKFFLLIFSTGKIKSEMNHLS